MIEIAGGIVLAVLVLVFLPEILALGMIAIAVAVLLAVVAAVLYFGFAEPVLTITLLAVAAFLVVAAYFDTQDSPTARKLKRIGEIVGFAFVALLIAGLMCLGAVVVVHLEIVPVVLVVVLLIPALALLIKAYSDVFGLSPRQRKFLEAVSLGIKWLPANNTAQPGARDEAARAAGRGR